MRLSTRLKAIGKKLKHLRIDKELSQEQLSESTGLTREHLSRLECGKSPITVKNLYILADFFEVDIKEFFS